MHHKIKQLQQIATPINHTDLAVRADMKLYSGEDRIIRGYLIVWGVRDTYGTIFVKGSCKKSIEERGPSSNANYKITALWQHDMKDPIGQFRKMEEDDYGLYVEIVADEGVESAERALRQVKSGTINQMSAGFNYVWDKMDYNEETDSIILREVQLLEGSLVTMGSNSETFTYRSPEEFEAQNDYLRQDIEAFIKTLQPKKQVEARQLFTRSASLYKSKPQIDALRQPKPIEEGIDYTYLISNFKNLL